MKRAMAALALIALGSSSQAQPRPSTVTMPCGVSSQLVMSRGAIVLGTGGYTYDRFVRDVSFCEVGEYTQPAFVPSLDTPKCFVGYRCRTGPRDFWDD